MPAPNFVTSNQDFHNKLVKIVIDLKNLDLTFKSGSSQTKSFLEETGEWELSSENENLPFKMGELEHMVSMLIPRCQF